MTNKAEKERVSQERDGLSTTGKRQLQAFLRMERIAAEARAQGLELGEVKHRVDGKGVVIFALESGGVGFGMRARICYFPRMMKRRVALLLPMPH